MFQYHNIIQYAINDNEDYKKELPLLFLMYHYLELHIKLICWGNTEKPMSLLQLNNHNLKRIVEENKDNIIHKIEIHTEEEYNEIVDLVDTIYSYSGKSSNPSISFRYPVLSNSNEVEAHYNKVRSTSKGELVVLWERIKEIYARSITNRIYLYAVKKKDTRM